MKRKYKRKNRSEYKTVKVYIIYARPYFDETEIFFSKSKAEKYYKEMEEKEISCENYQSPIWMERNIKVWRGKL